MNFLRKLFNKFRTSNRSNHKGIPNYDLQWIEAKDSPWNVRVLDLRPVSQVMLSFSENLQGSNNALSYNLEDGSSFINQRPVTDESIEVDCYIPIHKQLEEGALFRPLEMEHKWAVFFRENKIIIVRGWQRQVFVIAETSQENNQLIITKIHGKFVFSEEPETFTKAALLFVLHSYCLEEIVPVPIPEDLIGDTNEAAIWVFKNFGNLAHYGYVGMDFKYQTNKHLKSDSLLHFAVLKENIDAINQSIEKGFNIHSLGTKNTTPLQLALYVNPKILVHLLQKGVDPNFIDALGETALMTAVELDSLEHLKLLLQAGALINTVNKKGFTALHKAAEMGRFKIVQYLLDKGADHSIVAQEHTPLSLAIMSKHKKIVKLLKRANL